MVSWLVVAAVIFDLLENVGMIAMIRGNFDGAIPMITPTLAIAKFTLLVTAILYVSAGLVARLKDRSAHAV